MKNKIIAIILFILLSNIFIYANNIKISNISIIEQDTISHSCKIQFNLSWENSWRTSTGAMNWDAAWIFVKYKIGENGQWKHATLSTNSNEHIAVTGSTIDAVNDGKGVFVYRTTDGTSNVSYNGMKLKWYYGLDSISEIDSFQIKVIGIEMVYVTQGSFYAGNFDKINAGFTQGSDDYDPWYINSENELNITNGTGSGSNYGQTYEEYYYNSFFGNIDEDSTGSLFTIPMAFPKGFEPFYCMKYEISMAQYVEFLNLLTRQQQNSRTETDISSDSIFNIYVMSNTNYEVNRNTIICQQNNIGTSNPIVFSTSTPDRACNFLNWDDLAAILDWSGLRPMTEFEYEKACRGTQTATANEFAWGNRFIYEYPYTLIDVGTSGEHFNYIDSAVGNALYMNTNANINGPVRCGIFAGSAINNSRNETGSTFYGINEMCGNLAEQIITIGNSNGRMFTNKNGNGILDTNGYTNEPNWPVNGQNGSGNKGGGWNSFNISLCVSNREFAASKNTIRNNEIGGRGVRSFP